MLFASSFLLALAATLLLARLAPRLKLLDHPDHRKQHKTATPMVGGLAIYLVMLVMYLSGMAHSKAVIPLLLASSLITLVGALDDARNISAKSRLLAQLIAALVVIFGAGLQLEHLGTIGTSGGYVYLGPFAAIVTIFGIMSVINAINFIDGLDGLSGGLSLIAIAGVWLIFALNGETPPDLVPLLAGSLIAFLIFNARWFGRKHAALFLGDAGSTLLGLLLAWLMIEYTQGTDASLSPVTALWLLAIPLMDFLAIVLRRLAMGRSPLHPDREHVHHILLQIGHGEKQTTAIIHLLAIAFAATGVLSQYYHWPKNLMFYLFLALFFIFFWMVKHSWSMAKLLRKSEH